jgi:uncharacterized membrane protein (DUF485 family)
MVGDNMKNNKIGIFELIVTIIIVLVVVHTFLEDFAIVIGLDKDIQKALMIAGFCFDLFFTVEFLLRLFWARYERGALFYFTYRHGWIDFFASVPLLMLNSGPPFISMISNTIGFPAVASIAGLSMLKLLKIIRIARVLRLLRILKIFKNIKYTKSKMAQRHVTKIITLGVTTLVVLLILINMVMDVFYIARPDELYNRKKNQIIEKIKSEYDSGKDVKKALSTIQAMDTSETLLIIKVDGITIYSRYKMGEYDNIYQYSDYKYRRSGNIEVFFDVKMENKILAQGQARDNLIFFFIILGLLCAYLIFYSPHFALTVTDPIYVMKRGFHEKDYNLEVKIPSLYSTDDVFALARLYNEQYLPTKDRLMDTEQRSILTVKPEDIKYLTDI